MPQNILGLLNQFALRNVPKPTVQQDENRDFKAQAIQDQQPMWKKLAGGALDALTSGLTQDPFADPTSSVQKGLTRPSTGSKVGMMAAALPGIPRLPVIAPEAYNDVKAGGLRLYSRLTDAFAKAPGQMMPEKVRSIAKQGASAEEVGLRKLEEFLKGKPELAKIPREDVMQHLAQNPLELDVVRKGKTVEGKTAADDFRAMTHDFDTRYGNNWLDNYDFGGGAGVGTHAPTHDEYEAYLAADRRARDEILIAPLGHRNDTEWSGMQTPGPKSNYRETLINLPEHPDIERSIQEQANLKNQLDDFMSRTGMKILPGSTKLHIGQFDPSPAGDAAVQEYFDLQRRYQDQINKSSQLNQDLTFSSPHWTEPNNLLHTRTNDRALQHRLPTVEDRYDIENAKPQTYVDDDGYEAPWTNDANLQEWMFPLRDGSGGISTHGHTLDEALADLKDWHARNGDRNPIPVGPKGTYTEELQSDWAQQGREKGFKGDPLPPHTVFQDNEGIDYQEPRFAVESDYFPAALSSYSGSPEQSEELFRQGVDSVRPPQLPAYKNTAHELGLKQELLDWANNPESEWYGFGDSRTVSAMEGHPYPKAGMVVSQDERNPSALQRLLKPFGAPDPAHVRTDWEMKPKSYPAYNNFTVGEYTNDAGTPLRDRIVDVSKFPAEHVADTITPDQANTHQLVKQLNAQRHPDVPLSSNNKAGIWGIGHGINMSKDDADELKRQIAQRGFPAMAALLALQQAMKDKDKQ